MTFPEDLLGERVGLFAYPNGKPGEDYLPESVEVVRSLGFDAAVSTQWGASRFGDDLLQIKRFTQWTGSGGGLGCGCCGICRKMKVAVVKRTGVKQLSARVLEICQVLHP